MSTDDKEMKHTNKDENPSTLSQIHVIDTFYPLFFISSMNFFILEGFLLLKPVAMAKTLLTCLVF